MARYRRIEESAVPLRSHRILDDLCHGGFLWRSDFTGTCYRWRSGVGWQMFYENRWQACYNESSPAYYRLFSDVGETFIRVGKEI